MERLENKSTDLVDDQDYNIFLQEKIGEMEHDLMQITKRKNLTPSFSD